MAGLDIVSISCGEETSAAVSSSGKLYMWGSALDGIIPNSLKTEIVSEPTKISIKQKIVDIQFGSSFAVALTSKGSLMTWGKNDYGQLGRSVMNAPSFSPTSLKSIKHPITGFSCGKDFTIAWNSQEDVLYAWGKNPPCMKPSTNVINDEFWSIPYPHQATDFKISCSQITELSSYESLLLILEYSLSDSSISYETKEDENGVSYLQVTSVEESHFVEGIITVEFPREEMYNPFYDSLLLTYRLNLKSVVLFKQLSLLYPFFFFPISSFPIILNYISYINYFVYL